MSENYIFDSKDLPEIPLTIKTFWGETLETSEDIWYLNDVGLKTKIDFDKYQNQFIKYSVKIFIGTLAYSKSLSHIYNFERALSFLGDINSPKLEQEVIKKINSEIKNKRNTDTEYSLWYLKSWYNWCTDLDFPYFDSDYSDYLENIQISGNAKGQAVLSLEEDEGPLNDFELSTIIKLLNEDKKNSQGKRLAFLLLTLGANPRNLLLLKWSDFSVLENDGHKVYLLKVPRIKKRQQNREDFKIRELDSRVGRLFEEARRLDSDYIFLRSDGTPFTTMALRMLSINYFKKLVESSPLENIAITPRRFRYTFATQLVMSGVSKERLADLLDHSDLQHVQVYYDLRHKIKGFLTEAENQKIGDIFRRFEGTIVSNKSDLNKDIKYYSKKPNSSLGKCGSDTSCDLNAPYSCFVCKKFNAFSDCVDTYKEVRDDLISWKKSRSEEFDENDKIQHQMDEVLSALKDLISRIENKND